MMTDTMNLVVITREEYSILHTLLGISVTAAVALAFVCLALWQTRK